MNLVGENPRPVPVLNGALLGVDYGLRRVGLAVCDPEGRTAVGAGRIESRSGRDLQRLIIEIARFRGVRGVVLGSPSPTLGNEALREAVRRLSKRLDQSAIPLALWPEQFSTASALAERKLFGGKGKAVKLWADEAAAIIYITGLSRLAESPFGKLHRGGIIA